MPTVITTDQLIQAQTPLNPAEQGGGKVMTTLAMDQDLGFFAMETSFSKLFSLHQVTLNFRQETLLLSENSGEYSYGLAVMSAGSDDATFGDHSIGVRKGSSIFTFNPSMPECHRFMRDTLTRVSYFEINRDFLDTIFFDETDFAGQHMNRIKSRVLKNEFAQHATDYSLHQQRLVSDLAQCHLSGSLGTMFQEGCLQQLIALQFSYAPQITAHGERISSRDKQILNAIKDHLDTNFLEDHSLLSLAKQFGINQCKLKRQFKELFGLPVIEYLFNLKMEHAKQLLLDQQLNVTEVAPVVGYRYANHFATAFKRKFGFPPSALKG